MQQRNFMRRSFLAIAAMAVAGPLAGCERGVDAGKRELTVISFGGAYQEAQRSAYMTPFAQNTGTKIVEGTYNGDYGVLSERARAPSGTWSVVSVESAPALRGERDGLFLSVPTTVYEGLNLPASARRPAAAGHLRFSTILGYRTDAPEPHPKTWTDFWDVERFPGERGLRNNPRGTLEIALLADGVPSDQLYPLDLDRAFRKLDTLRPHIVFWESGAQPVQLLANKTVSMTSVYNGRIWHGQVNDKLPLRWSMNQGLLETEYWAVPKNVVNPELAFQFIRFSLEVKQQAAFANTIAYIPTNRDAEPLIARAVKAAVPDTELGGGQIDVNAEWWAQHEAEAAARWQQWTAR
ncbi:MAG: putative spermidine/putrescine transport system substrate-binding protein [Alphaproteobacteria bacterium]|jgi:putative spermidine/putrescine transport system substrate-binding protein|nr:putative spermidine/putrescine transport system substrate-binding protein [Alphaproteobacteria bacterium]